MKRELRPYTLIAEEDTLGEIATRHIGRAIAIAALLAVSVSGCGTGDLASSGDVARRRITRGDDKAVAKPPSKRPDIKQTDKRRKVPRAIRGPSAYVSRVIDGDTIEVAFRGRTVDVRLIGIDTPESVHPTEPDECFGQAASNYVESRLEGRRVRLEFDVERLDRYGRTLAYVWVGRTLFNRKIVADGFAQMYTFPPNVRYVDSILAAQRDARRHDRGLWKACPRGRALKSSAVQSSPPRASSGCTIGYSPCLPPAEDYDCAGGSGNGPKYTGRVRVTGDDPYELDADGDGIACD